MNQRYPQTISPYETIVLSEAQQKNLINYNHLTYGLYVLGYFSAGLLFIVPIVMNYVKRSEAEGTWLATHFDWQIKTFWYGFLMSVLGLVLVLIAIGGLGIGVLAESAHMAVGSMVMLFGGVLLCLFAVLWSIYRIARGWIALVDKRPVP